MQFTWHLIVIVVLVLLGLYLFQMSRKRVYMNIEQVQRADRYRNAAFISWIVAAGLAFYYYFTLGEEVFSKASMPGSECGCSSKANMCSGMPRY
jgi:hypothetical protein